METWKHSLGLPFLAPRKIASRAACGLRVTHGWKALAWRSFVSGNSPWALVPREEGSHTHRESQSDIQTSVPSRFLYRRDRVRLGLSGTFLDPMGTLCVKLDTGPGGKIRIFLLGSPNEVWPSTCLKIHPIALFFLLTELALLSPFGFLKQGGGPQLLAWGQFEEQGNLEEVTTVWNPALSDPLLQSASSWAVLLWPRNVFRRFAKFRETHGPDSGI